MPKSQCLAVAFTLLCFFVGGANASAAGGDTESRFRASDGAFDISGALDRAGGFVPVLIPITEPALGYGAALALVFIDKGEGNSSGFERPDVSALGGLRTDNGTQGLFLADSRYWREGTVQTTAALFDADVNLAFYGLTGKPRDYSLSTRGSLLRMKYRIGERADWFSVGWSGAETDVGFAGPGPSPDMLEGIGERRQGAWLLGYHHDTRDNVFTPTGGTLLQAEAALFMESAGSDDDHRRLAMTAIHYRKLSSRWYAGALAAFEASSGDTPFYLIPSVRMRGIPAMSLQGRRTGQFELEVRRRLGERNSLVVFGGVAQARDLLPNRSSRENAYAGGLGWRYEIARRYGLHMGLDAAHGPEGMAYYIQFGSAWQRP